MTDHDHKQAVPGCYRCDLGRDEERESMLAEIDTLRADLRKAMELLHAYRTAWYTKEEWRPLEERADTMLAKHKKVSVVIDEKETP